MKRALTIGAVAALMIGVSIPAAAIERGTDPQLDLNAPTTRAAVGEAQDLEVTVAAPVSASRDAFSAAAKPAPVVEETSYASSYSSTYSGPIPTQFLGMFSVWPANGPLGDGYGYRPGSYSGDFHAGIDILAPRGSAAMAAADGIVTETSSGGGYGNYVVIAHGDGVETLYAHLDAIWVGAGQTVGAGEGIGAVGSTGYSTVAHLHFEVYIGGSTVDPMQFFG